MSGAVEAGVLESSDNDPNDFEFEILELDIV